MAVMDTKFGREFSKVAQSGWELGWHERNGGNLSYRLSSNDLDLISDVLEATPTGEWHAIGWDEPVCIPDVAGEFFMITASGEHFQNVAHNAEKTLGIIEIDPRGENYRTRWGFACGGHPSSELPTHLMNHAVKKSIDNEYRVIYHAHPANTIALTFVLPHDDEVFTKELWSMISECAMVFPDGVGVVGWYVPGSKKIAEATAKVMQDKDVAIWVHHGMFCAGRSFDEAFGLAHTVEKASEIAVKVHSMGVDPSKCGITRDNLNDLAREYGLDLKY